MLSSGELPWERGKQILTCLCTDSPREYLAGAGVPSPPFLMGGTTGTEGGTCTISSYEVNVAAPLPPTVC